MKLKGSVRQTTVLGVLLCVLQPEKSVARIRIEKGQQRRRVFANLPKGQTYRILA